MVCYLFLPSFHLSTLPAAVEKEDKDEGGRELANERVAAVGMMMRAKALMVVLWCSTEFHTYVQTSK